MCPAILFHSREDLVELVELALDKTTVVRGGAHSIFRAPAPPPSAQKTVVLDEVSHIPQGLFSSAQNTYRVAYSMPAVLFMVCLSD